MCVCFPLLSMPFVYSMKIYNRHQSAGSGLTKRKKIIKTRKAHAEVRKNSRNIPQISLTINSVAITTTLTSSPAATTTATIASNNVFNVK